MYRSTRAGEVQCESPGVVDAQTRIVQLGVEIFFVGSTSLATEAKLKGLLQSPKK